MDGGLTSNLPSMLFDKEYRETGVFTTLFDLVQKEQCPEPARNLLEFGQHLLKTAIESSDQLFLENQKGNFHIEIDIPVRYKTLDFHLSQNDRKDLFRFGSSDAHNAITQSDRIKILRKAGASLAKELQGRNCHDSLISPILSALLREIADASNAKELRASIFLPSSGGRLLLVYNHAFRKTDRDQYIELGPTEGIATKAFKNIETCYSQFDERNHDYQLEPENAELIPDDRKSLFSIPISFSSKGSKKEGVIGVLGVDTASTLEEIGWGADKQTEIFAILLKWMHIIHAVLKANRL